MSLIQEALRRQQEEADGTPMPEAEVLGDALASPPRAGSIVPAAGPPPLPVPEPMKTRATPLSSVVEPAPAEKSRTWPILLGVLLIVLLLGGGGVWMTLYAMKNLGDRDGSGATDPAGTDAPAPVASQVEPAPEPPRPKPLEPQSEPVKAAPGSTAPQPAPLGADPVAPPPTEPAVVPAESPTQAIVTPPPVEVLWPSLTLSGVVGKGINGAATLNGRVFGVGENVEGATITLIGGQSVELEYEGEARTLKVGQTTTD